MTTVSSRKAPHLTVVAGAEAAGAVMRTMHEINGLLAAISTGTKPPAADDVMAQIEVVESVDGRRPDPLFPRWKAVWQRLLVGEFKPIMVFAELVSKPTGYVEPFDIERHDSAATVLDFHDDLQSSRTYERTTRRGPLARYASTETTSESAANPSDNTLLSDTAPN